MNSRILLALLLSGSLLSAQPSPVRFGCQARTFGEGIYKDETAFLEVVRQIGELGFEGLETNWKNLERYFDRPADFSKILTAARLKLIGAHLGGSPGPRHAQILDEVERTARFVKAVGGECVVFSGSYPKARPLPAGAWQNMADLLNEAGRVCAKHGVRCLYHNHWVECESDGIEQLCRFTDPKLVGFAFDTGHAVRAGKDPAVVIATLGGRLGLIHFADASEEMQSTVKRPPLGTGRLNIPAVVDALRQAGFSQWIVLEEETTGSGRPLAEQGHAIFRRAFQQTE